ncbi:hypothetical protein AAG906_016380 [Vitis piasezkii]
MISSSSVCGAFLLESLHSLLEFHEFETPHVYDFVIVLDLPVRHEVAFGSMFNRLSANRNESTVLELERKCLLSAQRNFRFIPLQPRSYIDVMYWQKPGGRQAISSQ